MLKGARAVTAAGIVGLVACGAATTDFERLDPYTNEEAVDSVTQGATKPTGRNGDSNYCDNPLELCAFGEGDCDSNAQCASGLSCIPDNGAKFGFHYTIDICAGSHCNNKVLDGDETAVDCGGSCSSPGFDCASYCPDHYWATFPNGHSHHCTLECPCPSGQGDCDSDAQCGAGLVCGNKNGFQFGFPGQDFCVPATCRNGILDPDETFPDCGGPCSAPGFDCGEACTGYWATYANGHDRHCTDVCPCPSGHGDCDSDAECQPGTVCIADNGDKFGFPAGHDICAPATCRNGVQDPDEDGIDCGGPCSSMSCEQYCDAYKSTYPNGNAKHCSVTCPCATGQGDCDSDAECEPGNVCVNNGDKFGFPGLQFCVPETCRNGVLDPGEEAVDCGGPCSSVPCDQHCANYWATRPNGHGSHCTATCPCPSGEGDCDSDAECQPGLVCGKSNSIKFGFPPGTDHCVPPTCVNGIQDEDETAVDCGGPCGDCGQFMGIGDLPGGAFESYAQAVSKDGSVIVGRGETENGSEAFRWTAAGGMQSLGDLPGGQHFSVAYGVSDNGSVVVGRASSESGTVAFKWTAADGLIGLGKLAGGASRSEAWGVSRNGAVVVGLSGSANGLEAFRHAGTMEGLGDLPGGSFQSQAWAANSDGSVVVGRGRTEAGREAFFWTASTGMISLGDLPGGPVDSLATAVSSNGRIVAGDATTADGVRAFRWTAGTGMTDLGVPAGMAHSYAYGISSNGTRIVGTATDAAMENNIAFLWIEGVGMRSLQEIIEEQGGAIEGWTLLGATAISADGRVIVGYGYNPDGNIEAFRAVIP